MKLSSHPKKKNFSPIPPQGFTKAAAFVANNLLPSHSNGAYLDSEKAHTEEDITIHEERWRHQKVSTGIYKTSLTKGWTFAGTHTKQRRRKTIK